jgi:hypothetical protein
LPRLPLFTKRTQFANSYSSGMPIPEVHLNATGRRDSTAARANPLGERFQPSRAAGLDAIVRYLNVESSVRYTRTSETTFCNVYAYDYCTLAGVYLPRVWWTRKALDRIAAGENVAIKYGETVAEVNANLLYEWLREFGPQFGWRSVDSAKELQQAANAGKIAVICARRQKRSKSGHIAVVVPESAPLCVAQREGAHVRLPLQSQAGATNFCFSCGKNEWWAGAQFDAYGFWIHD